MIMEKELKSCVGVLLRDDLTWHSHPSPFSQNGCPVKSALKKTPVQDFNYFSLMFLCIISTTYQNIGDLFCPVIFLDFRTVCSKVFEEIVFTYI